MKSVVETKEKPSASADKNAKHTPWSWELNMDSREFDITDANGERIMWGNVNRGIEYSDPRVPTLLRAAPELLEACKKIRNATHPTSSYFEIVNSAIVKAEGHKPETIAAAIAKAEGRAS